ncbi:MAG: leucine-rich repeat protein [Eggerthellaceae bacterium]|nr:leucine-rich repeat protein [Eggerthellaceae bacterium]
MGVSMGINLSADTSRLEVCFGGFSPTAMNATAGAGDIVEKAEALMRERREMNERLAAIEAARASEPSSWTDAEGTEWTYVVLDGDKVRIERCKTSVANLVIPGEIEGMPVVSLAADACAYLPDIRTLTCADSIISIGYCAFRGCKNLRKAVLPASVGNYDSGWLRACDKLEELHLPGRLEKLCLSIFDATGLKRLRVGAGTLGVEAGAFGRSSLEAIEVNAENPFMKTDGVALYSTDGSALLALAVPVEQYRVAEGCRSIARKGFSGFASLKKVELPDSLEVVEGYAFFRTGLLEIEMPASLREVGERAFFNCRSLRKITFAEGLRTVGQHAFTATSIGELRLPSTVEVLGNPLAEGVTLTYSGPEATFSIASGGKALELDALGGLYRHAEEGLEFACLLNPEIERYEVCPGVLNVGEEAFANHPNLKEAVLPDGLAVIKRGAFKGCRTLKTVNVPESATRIEDEAFLDTNIESIYLPSGLVHLGVNALVTQGAHYSASNRSIKVAPSLREISVGAENRRFEVRGGLLLEHAGTDGSMRVLLYAGDVEVVRIPAEVNEIAPYALNNAHGIRELYLSDRIVMVGIRGLAVDGFVELIHVDLVKAQFGKDFFELRFPGTDRGMQQMMLALSVPDHVNVEVMFEHYDTAITNGSSFDAATEKGLALYDQATRLLDRLADPVFLSRVNRDLCERFLRNNAEDVCVALARQDDRAAIDAMLDLGYLNADNIYDVIERVGALQDATLTNYLLEARRLRFEQSVFDDFDL